jgi:hypothetical protein
MAINSITNDRIVYLFHLIEFVDIYDDGVPSELHVHPSINMRIEKKIKLIEDTLKLILKRYAIVRTDQFVLNYKENFLQL